MYNFTIYCKKTLLLYPSLYTSFSFSNLLDNPIISVCLTPLSHSSNTQPTLLKSFGSLSMATTKVIDSRELRNYGMSNSSFLF